MKTFKILEKKQPSILMSFQQNYHPNYYSLLYYSAYRIINFQINTISIFLT